MLALSPFCFIFPQSGTPCCGSEEVVRRLEAGGTGGGNEEVGGGWRDWGSTGYHVCRNCVMQKILLGEEGVSTVYIL